MIKMQILQQQSRRILANYSIRKCLSRRSYKTLSAVTTDLEQWRKDLGDQVKPSYVRGLIKNYRDSNQFSEALEASEWMCKQRVFNIFSEDYAARLHLVDTVLGLEEAEKFFQSIPEDMRDYSVYDNLLRSYTRSEKTLDKAEATFEKMRDLGFLMKPSPFNSMISLYGSLKKKDMVKKLEREMMEYNVQIDSRNEATDVLSLCKRYIRIVYHAWHSTMKEKKKMDDKYRSKISNLLKLDDVQGAEKLYKEWKPWGTKLDMSIPSLLISRFCAEGNGSKVAEMVNSIRKKRIVMHLRTVSLWLAVLGFHVVLLAFVVAIAGTIVGCNVWLLTEYPILSVKAFCVHLILKHPILFASLCYYITAKDTEMSRSLGNALESIIDG